MCLLQFICGASNLKGLQYDQQEYWCKRLHPKNVAEKVYRQPPLRISLRSGRLNKQDFKFTKHQTTLLLAADSIGKKIQYNCHGFLPNQRQVSLLKLYIFQLLRCHQNYPPCNCSTVQTDECFSFTMTSVLYMFELILITIKNEIDLHLEFSTG